MSETELQRHARWQRERAVAELEAQLSKATPVGFWHTHPEHARRGEFSSNALRCADRADGWTEQTVTVTAQGVS